MKQLFLLLFLFFCFALSAQQADEGHSKELKEISERYFSKSGMQASLFSGREQTKYLLGIKGHPYLDGEEYTPESLVYDGVRYPDVQLRLDLYRDELLLRTPDQKLNIVLSPNLFNEASIHGYRLLYTAPTEKRRIPYKGYFLQLYQGKCEITKKVNCNYNEQVDHTEIVRSFSQSSKYFLQKDSVYYTINNRSALLKALKDEQKTLKQYIRRENIDFKNDYERAVIEVVKEYEKLKAHE